MSELLKRSIETLSAVTNLSTGLGHPFDEARAKELFKALHVEGEPLGYETVRTLAIENHWPDRHADDLAALAQRIGEGGRVVIEHPREWGEATVERIKAEISAENP